MSIFFILLFIGPHFIIPYGKGFSGNAMIQCLTPRIFAKKSQHTNPTTKIPISSSPLQFVKRKNTFCNLEKYILQKMIIENELRRPKSILTTLNLGRESWVGQQLPIALSSRNFSLLLYPVETVKRNAVMLSYRNKALQLV